MPQYKLGGTVSWAWFRFWFWFCFRFCVVDSWSDPKRKICTLKQCCQIVHLHNKTPNSGIFWKALEWKMQMVLCRHGVLYGVWSYIFPILVCCTNRYLETLGCFYKK
jgi:hypothetical protein